jgi:hypothetical protein
MLRASGLTERAWLLELVSPSRTQRADLSGSSTIAGFRSTEPTCRVTAVWALQKVPEAGRSLSPCLVDHGFLEKGRRSGAGDSSPRDFDGHETVRGDITANTVEGYLLERVGVIEHANEVASRNKSEQQDQTR